MNTTQRIPVRKPKIYWNPEDRFQLVINDKGLARLLYSELKVGWLYMVVSKDYAAGSVDLVPVGTVEEGG